MSPFLSACAHVSALLGPADATERTPLPAADSHVTVARWRHVSLCRDSLNESITVRAYDDTPDVVLVAERLDGDARTWTAIGDATVRDACAWLGWPVPRPSPAPTFASALSAATALLGAPATVTAPPFDTAATWRVYGGELLLSAHAAHLCVEASWWRDGRTGSLLARLDGPAGIAPAVTDAVRYLRVEAEPDAAPIAAGYDADGSPVDDHCDGDQRSTTVGALGEGEW